MAVPSIGLHEVTGSLGLFQNELLSGSKVFGLGRSSPKQVKNDEAALKLLNSGIGLQMIGGLVLSFGA